MQTYLDCYPCILRQAIEAARMAGVTPAQQKVIVSDALRLLQEVPNNSTPPAIAVHIHQLVRKLTGQNDPYIQVKKQATEEALALVPKLRSLIKSSSNELETAIRLSIAGNILDFGPGFDSELADVINRVLSEDLTINNLPLLIKRLEIAKSVLILGDNAGETVFDRLLIETLHVPVTYAVRGGPILNDATLDDAISAGVDQVAKIIDNGTRIPGTVLSECSLEFQSHFNSADLILAKGMGNYETLSTTPGPLFFLLLVKCPVVSVDIGAPVGSMIVKFTSAEM